MKAQSSLSKLLHSATVFICNSAKSSDVEYKQKAVEDFEHDFIAKPLKEDVIAPLLVQATEEAENNPGAPKVLWDSFFSPYKQQAIEEISSLFATQLEKLLEFPTTANKVDFSGYKPQLHRATVEALRKQGITWTDASNATTLKRIKPFSLLQQLAKEINFESLPEYKDLVNILRGKTVVYPAQGLITVATYFFGGENYAVLRSGSYSRLTLNYDLVRKQLVPVTSLRPTRLNAFFVNTTADRSEWSLNKTGVTLEFTSQGNIGFDIFLPNKNEFSNFDNLTPSVQKRVKPRMDKFLAEQQEITDRLEKLILELEKFDSLSAQAKKKSARYQRIKAEYDQAKNELAAHGKEGNQLRINLGNLSIAPAHEDTAEHFKSITVFSNHEPPKPTKRKSTKAQATIKSKALAEHKDNVDLQDSERFYGARTYDGQTFTDRNLVLSGASADQCVGTSTLDNPWVSEIAKWALLARVFSLPLDTLLAALDHSDYIVRRDPETQAVLKQCYATDQLRLQCIDYFRIYGIYESIAYHLDAAKVTISPVPQLANVDEFTFINHGFEAPRTGETKNAALAHQVEKQAVAVNLPAVVTKSLTRKHLDNALTSQSTDGKGQPTNQNLTGLAIDEILHWGEIFIALLKLNNSYFKDYSQPLVLEDAYSLEGLKRLHDCLVAELDSTDVKDLSELKNLMGADGAIRVEIQKTIVALKRFLEDRHREEFWQQLDQVQRSEALKDALRLLKESTAAAQAENTLSLQAAFVSQLLIQLLVDRNGGADDITAKNIFHPGPGRLNAQSVCNFLKRFQGIASYVQLQTGLEQVVQSLLLHAVTYKTKVGAQELNINQKVLQEVAPKLFNDKPDLFLKIIEDVPLVIHIDSIKRPTTRKSSKTTNAKVGSGYEVCQKVSIVSMNGFVIYSQNDASSRSDAEICIEMLRKIKSQMPPQYRILLDRVVVVADAAYAAMANLYTVCEELGMGMITRVPRYAATVENHYRRVQHEMNAHPENFEGEIMYYYESSTRGDMQANAPFIRASDNALTQARSTFDLSDPEQQKYLDEIEANIKKTFDILENQPHYNVYFQDQHRFTEQKSGPCAEVETKAKCYGKKVNAHEWIVPESALSELQKEYCEKIPDSNEYRWSKAICAFKAFCKTTMQLFCNEKAWQLCNGDPLLVIGGYRDRVNVEVVFSDFNERGGARDGKWSDEISETATCVNFIAGNFIRAIRLRAQAILQLPSEITGVKLNKQETATLRKFLNQLQTDQKLIKFLANLGTISFRNDGVHYAHQGNYSLFCKVMGILCIDEEFWVEKTVAYQNRNKAALNGEDNNILNELEALQVTNALNLYSMHEDKSAEVGQALMLMSGLTDCKPTTHEISYDTSAKPKNKGTNNTIAKCNKDLQDQTELCCGLLEEYASVSTTDNSAQSAKSKAGQKKQATTSQVSTSPAANAVATDVNAAAASETTNSTSLDSPASQASEQVKPEA